MPHIPPSVAESKESRALAKAGLKRIHQGKVRDSYEIPDHPDWMLVVATDRISIFDFVLSATVPQKGEVLTALTHFWLTEALKGVPNHLIPSKGNPRLNAVHDLASISRDIPLRRSLVVRKIDTMIPYELIFRHCIGGSIYPKYAETGMAHDQRANSWWDLGIPPNLPKWSLLERPLFTPSTKAQNGHDLNVSPASFYAATGVPGRVHVDMCMNAFIRAHAFAKKKGILILDTKFEAGGSMLADEVLTPDSSRFVKVDDYDSAMAKAKDPPFYDKETVRNWGREVPTPKGMGINRLTPESDEDLAFVDTLSVPTVIVEQTAALYASILRALVGESLLQYQRLAMGIA